MIRSVLITGCSSGFGYYTANFLRKQGIRVVATVRRREDLRLHPDSMLLDVTWPQAKIDRTIKNLIQKRGSIDCLVNNAGYGHLGNISKLSVVDLQSQLEVNLLGTFKVTKALLPHFRRRKQGLIINVSSILGLFTLPGYSIYSASKFALEALSSGLRQEEHANGIKVVTINPGAFKTSFQIKAVSVGGQKEKPSGPSPQRFSALLYSILQADKPKSRYVVGQESLAVTLLMLLPERVRENLLGWYLNR